MTKKQQKQFNELCAKLIKKRKTTNFWWNYKPSRNEQKLGLAALREYFKKLERG